MYVPAVVSLLFSTFIIAAKVPHSYINYTTVTGYFLQDDPATNATTFNFTTTNFGLINRTYPSDSTRPQKQNLTQWQRFARQVSLLNRNAPHGVEYKVLFMGRHGDGFHNDAQAYYGTPAWNCYYSIRDGNATVTWADAHLSPLASRKRWPSMHSGRLSSQSRRSPRRRATTPAH